MADLLTWDAYPPPDNLPAVIINDPKLPLVSIVTPSYNQARFIAETIESVLTQDYPNIEYWVIDGGSTDETVSVLKSYEDDPRFHWLSEPDRGQSDAINKGWSRCRGKIIAYLNSDDTYCPYAVQSQVNFLLQNPHIDIVYGDCVFTDQAGKHLYISYGKPFQALDLLRFVIPLQPTTFLTQKASLESGPIDCTFNYSMDSEYWNRLHKNGFGFAYNPCQVATYRLHDTSKTVTDLTKLKTDQKRIIDMYASSEQRSTVLADWYMAKAIYSVKIGAIPLSMKQAMKAIFIKPTRRIALYLLVILEKITGIPVSRFVLEHWMQSQRYENRY